MKRPLIYVSHPFSSAPELNRVRARNNVRLLANEFADSYTFVNPLDLFKAQSDVLDDDVILEQAIEVMKRCDGVLFCEGWEHSHGCCEEYKVAREINLPRWFGFYTFIQSYKDMVQEASQGVFSVGYASSNTKRCCS